MPKKAVRDKRRRAPLRNGAGPGSRRVHSVKELLGQRTPALTRVAAQAARAVFWSEWLAQRLPDELRARLSGVVERDGILVIFAETAAWSARLRYAVVELTPAMHAADSQLSNIEVRVLPRH